jgi:predicted transcriptional regulator of viral defense system
MKWEQFLNDVKDQPVIESRYLHLLYPNPREVDLQISRWLKQKKIHRLKKGFYLLDEKYRQAKISESYVAAILKSPSYISLEKALEIYHLIPDVVYAYTSVTTKRRPAEFITPVGRFNYSCLKKDYFWGYRVISEQDGKGYLGEPEKAIIDLFYLAQKKIDKAFIHSLRLQNTEQLNREKLIDYAGRMGVPFVVRAVSLLIEALAEAEDER